MTKLNLIFKCLCLLLAVSSLNCARQSGNSESKYLKKVPGCDAKALKKADRTLAKLVTVGTAGRKFPESTQQLPGYCTDSEELVNELNKFVLKCYAPEIRDMAKIMIYSVRNMIKQFCKKRSKKLNKLMSIAPCINTEVRNNTCMSNFIERVAKLQYIEKDKMKIPHTCCQYVSAMGCVENYLGGIPCARKNLPIVLDFIKGLFGNMANFACGDYNESTTRCEELGPPPKPLVKNTKKYNTFMFVLIDLMESMDGFQLVT